MGDTKEQETKSDHWKRIYEQIIAECEKNGATISERRQRQT
jgi:hypothetical protein